MPSRSVTGFNWLSTYNHARPRDSTTRQRREQRVDRRRLLRLRRSSPRRFAAPASRRFERARIAAALLHARDELLLLVGRHGLEAFEHARLELGTLPRPPPPPPPPKPPRPPPRRAALGRRSAGQHDVGATVTVRRRCAGVTRLLAARRCLCVRWRRRPALIRAATATESAAAAGHHARHPEPASVPAALPD